MQSRTTPATGRRQSLRAALRHYAELVIAPSPAQRLRPGELDALRLRAAHACIQAALKKRADRLSIAHDLALFLESAHPAAPWRGMDRLTLEALAMDTLHAMKRRGVR